MTNVIFDYDFRDVSEMRIGLSVIYRDFALIMCINYTLQIYTFDIRNGKSLKHKPFTQNQHRE